MRPTTITAVAVGLLVVLAGCTATTATTSTTTTASDVVAGTVIHYSAADTTWRGPVTIRLEKQHPRGDWISERTVTARDGTRARVDLIPNRTYRVTIENTAGKQLIAGRFTAKQYRQDIHVTPNGCCITIENDGAGDNGGGE